MDYLEHYRKMYNLDYSKAEKRALVKNENGTRTALKEMIGEAIIKESRLFDLFFPDNIGFKKISSKKLQKAGADYEVYLSDNQTVYVDLKSLVGPDYTMYPDDYVSPKRIIKDQKAIVVEIYQNDLFTNYSSKMTDFVLYTIADSTGVYAYLVPYKAVVDLSKEHKAKYIVEGDIAKRVQSGYLKWYTSNNGSGIYIKVNAESIACKTYTKYIGD